MFNSRKCVEMQKTIGGEENGLKLFVRRISPHIHIERGRGRARATNEAGGEEIGRT